MPFRSPVFALVFALVLAFAPTARAASPEPVAAQNGMVVSAHRLASQVGVDVLKNGGSAVDAAVAVGYALAVTFPAAGNLGGGGFMLIRKKDGAATFIDFREVAPGAATRDMFLDAAGDVVPGRSMRGYLAAGVPGTVAGLELAREKYGTRSRAALMAPAIALARKGFVLDQGDADLLAEAADDFAKDAPSAKIFLNRGRPFAPGERFVQTDLANSLTLISRDGAKAFYDGPIAERVVAASRANGGIFTRADFAGYRARELAPLTCDYRGYRILSAPPPSSGGIVICQTLNILEAYPMGEFGFHSADGAHYLYEAWRRAYRDRNLNLGDPSFVQIDTQRFIDKGYAQSLRAGIAKDRATLSSSLGGPAPVKEGNNTTHYSIVDAAGNAVAVTYTLNESFGARITAAGTGFLLNNEMDDFSAKPGASNLYGLVEGATNAVAPGKRPLSSMTPTIVTRNNALAMVLGTPGGSRIPTAVTQVLMNVIDYRMTIQEAVDAPRLHHQWLPDVAGYERFALSADTRRILEARGHKLQEIPYGNHMAAILVGAPSLERKPVGANRLYGAIDPRLNVGAAMGY